MARDAGVLMHITSLPSPCGIGTLGREAYRFADFLKAAGQRYWQILPVGPTSYGDSPYQSFSTYAGNPYLIDLDLLQEEGLLEKEEYEALDWGGDPLRVDYEALYRSRFQVLRLAYEQGRIRDREEFERFRRDNESWLGNYALFMAVKEHFGMISWLEWPDEGIRLRRKRSLVQYEKRLKAQVEFWEYVQFLFFRQWRRLKAYVNSPGDSDFWGYADLCGHGQRRYLVQPGDLLAGQEPQAGMCGGLSAGLLFGNRAALGGPPLYDWEFFEKDQIQLVDEPDRFDPPAVRRDPDRPLPRLRHVLRHPLRGGDRCQRPVDGGPGIDFFSKRCAGRWETCRSSPRIWGFCSRRCRSF